MDRSGATGVGSGMRWALLGLLVGCSTTRAPTATVSAPPPALEPACKGDECSAKLEAAPRFEPPGPDVDPPPIVEVTPAESATCATVGAVMASVELGNYADPEARVPATAKYTTRCEDQKLDQATRTCIANEADFASIAYCAPSMVPDMPAVAIVPATECNDIADAVTKRIRPASTTEQTWWKGRQAELMASCKTDRWTRQYVDCVKSQHVAYCTYQTPRPLAVKLQVVLAKADQRDAEQRRVFELAYVDPKKYPKVKLDLVRPDECTRVIAAVKKRIAAMPPNNWEQQWFTPRAARYLASCKADRWTRPVVECMKTQAVSNCHGVAPYALQVKMNVLYQDPPPSPAKLRRPKRP